MEHEYKQDDIALRQLERAIKLFLDERDFFSSATLAGAAEEIFGQMLKQKGQTNALERETSRLFAGLTNAERDALTDRQEKLRGVRDLLTFQRNWLKHLRDEDFTGYSDPRPEARDLIARAIDNYCDLFGSFTNEMERFREYQRHEYA